MKYSPATTFIPAGHSNATYEEAIDGFYQGIPTTLLGLQDRWGVIQPGASADLALLDEQLNLLEVLVAGEE